MLNRRQLLFSELLLVSFMCHCMVFLFLFVFYNCYRYSTKLSVARNTDFASFFVRSPLSRTSTSWGKSRTCAAACSKSLSAKRTSTKTEATAFINGSSHKKDSKKIKKFVARNEVKKTKKTKQPDKKKVNAEEKKKESPKIEQKKEEPKKTADAKPVEPKKEDPVVQKKNEQAEQKQQPEQLNDQQVAAQAVPPAEQQLQAIQAGDGDEIGDQNMSQMPLCEEEFDTPRILLHIQKEVAQKWAPPSGLPDDLVCDITIHVGVDGEIVDSVIDKSSGVLIFDVSARSAASSLSLPRWAWGKEFTISFNQA